MFPLFAQLPWFAGAPIRKKRPLSWRLHNAFRNALKWVQVVIFSRIFPVGIKSFYCSWRVRFDLHPEAQAMLDAGRPVVFAFWHGRMYASLRAFPTNQHKVSVLVSPSTDGEMIARCGRQIGFQHFVRGSHKRKGAQALRGLIRELTQEDRSVVFMVDGPRGPRYRVKPGVIRLAAQAGVPIIPVVSSSRWLYFRITRSWDHYNVPTHFAPMVIQMGQPLVLPEKLDGDSDVETYRAALETQMRTLTQALDQQMNQSETLP